MSLFEKVWTKELSQIWCKMQTSEFVGSGFEKAAEEFRHAMLDRKKVLNLTDDIIRAEASRLHTEMSILPFGEYEWLGLNGEWLWMLNMLDCEEG